MASVKSTSSKGKVGARLPAYFTAPDPEYPRCSNAEYHRRHESLRQLMREEGLDGLLIYGGYRDMYQQNARWASGFADSFHCYLVFPMEGEPSLYNTIYPHLLYARRVSVFRDTQWGGPEIAKTVVNRIKELGMADKRWGIVGVDTLRTGTLPYTHYLELTQGLPKATFTDVTGLVETLRSVKSAEELAFVRRGAEITDRLMEILVEKLHPGVHDYELYAELDAAAYRLGGEPNFALFASTSMATPAIPYPYPHPSHREIKAGDLILNELCANYRYYSGQLIRPIALGKPPKEYREIFNIALELFNAIKGAVRPGATTEDVLAAVKPIAARGTFYIQAPLVHGWDNKPDRPWIGLPGAERHFPVTPHVFKEGQLIMIEPNPCDLELKRGVFFGNLCVVTADGCANLQKFPNEFVVKA